MSLSQFKLIQPTIVKTKDVEVVPELVRDKYLINFNGLNIEWFEAHFQQVEDGFLCFDVASENRKGFECFILADDDDDPLNNPCLDVVDNSEAEDFVKDNFSSNVFDVPRIYIRIKPEYIEDDSLIFNFLKKAINDPLMYSSGIETFKYGVDFFINKTLYAYLTQILQLEVSEEGLIDNYLTTEGVLNEEVFEILSDTEEDYTNIEYYDKKNRMSDYTFTEEELDRFCQTFPKLILEFTDIDEDDLLDIKNRIYQACLEYFANGKTNCTIRGLALILQNSIGTPNTVTTNSYLGTCGTCNNQGNKNGNGLGNGEDKSCIQIYQEAMDSILKSMLGDTEFYEDWFTHIIGDDMIINCDLVALLVKLIDEYIESHQNVGKVKKSNNCVCATITKIKPDFVSILENYKKVLGYVCEGKINENRNKIKLYGEAFGELLPSLCS